MWFGGYRSRSRSSCCVGPPTGASKAAVFGILAASRLIWFCGRVFDMMMALITASPAVVSKNELVSRVWQVRIVDENRQSDTRLLHCAKASPKAAPFG
jgi:hypothetical protein